MVKISRKAVEKLKRKYKKMVTTGDLQILSRRKPEDIFTVEVVYDPELGDMVQVFPNIWLRWDTGEWYSWSFKAGGWVKLKTDPIDELNDLAKITAGL